MNKERYMEMRNALIDEAQALVDEGKLEDSAAKRAEIEKLDEQFENAAKEAANLAALAGKQAVKDISAQAVAVPGAVTLAGAVVDDLTASVDYRTQFMNYVVRGVPMQNADANTKTTDIGVLIPSTVLNKIIEKMEASGMILPLVTRTAYKGGVKIPVSTVKPVATWVAEGAGSDKQKKTVGSIDFAYNKLRCAISVSLETDTMALSVFETTFVNNVVEAMTIALETAIIKGTGSGQPKGILTETPNAEQALTVTPTGKLGYDTLIKAEAALPLSYEAKAVWLMTKKTFMAFAGMTDSNGQPIARVNYGINGKPERVLLGRQVVCNEYMGSYADTVTDDVIFAALFNMSDYVLNTNLNMTVKTYEDNDTDDQVTKAVMLVDGKTVDKNSLVTLTKQKKAA